ncbi:hypothetical protein EBU24_01025 [bacterium]|nr:hypothetical protein [bacterium]
MRKEEQIIVNNKTFHVKQLGARPSVIVQLELFSLYGEIKNKLIGNDIASIIKAISQSNSEKLLFVLEKILHNTDCFLDHEHKKIDMDNYFADDLFNMYEVAIKVIAFNYKDFFLQLGSGRLKTIIEEVTTYMKN